MKLYKKKGSPYYYIRFAVNKRRIEESSKSTSKSEAERFYLKRKQEVIDEELYGVKPKKTWKEVEKRWMSEMAAKRTIKQDQEKFIWLEPYFGKLYIDDITKDLIEEVAKKREGNTKSPASVNRLLALIRGVLNRASKQWEWLEKVPHVRMRVEDTSRTRWLTKLEAKQLIERLPQHLADMVEFTLATGLRASNVTQLKWANIDLQRETLLVESKDFKSNKNFSLPLNSTALNILKRLFGDHGTRVFTYQGTPINQCNTRAFRVAIRSLGIKNFRWHDLRHTWASWHVQAGTSLQELQQLGGWSSFEMVLKYAHLSRENLNKAANRIVEVIL